MKRTLCIACTLCCALQTTVVLASGPTEQMRYSYSELRSQIELLAADVESLKQAIEFSPKSAAERDKLALSLCNLQAELIRLNEQINTGNNIVISDDVLASRNGPAYISRTEPEPQHTSRLALSKSDSEDARLEISAFMDAVYETNATPSHGNTAHLNQVEVDFAKNVNDRAAASLGIIYDEGFQVGAALIDYKIKPESRESDSPLKSWTAFAGQFDVPFGEDVASYPSNVRKTVSTPGIVATTHNMWNEIGVASNWSFAKASVDAYAVRGFSLQSNNEIEEPAQLVNISSGSRLNFDLTNGIRCGGSCALGWLASGSLVMQMYGAHCVVTHGTWSFTAEGIVLQENVAGVALNRRGYYVQAIKELGHFFALTRADHLSIADSDSHNHLSLGGGAYIGSGLELRSEYRLDSDPDNNQGLVQVVATF